MPWWASVCCMRQTTMVRPKSNMSAPIPSWRRVCENRLSAATSSRARRRCGVPEAAPQLTSAWVAAVPTWSTRVLSMMRSPGRLAATSKPTRRSAWLGTIQPSRSSGLRGVVKCNAACCSGPSTTCAARMVPISLSARRCHCPSVRSRATLLCVSAISRPSSAGAASAARSCESSTVTDKPAPTNAAASASPAGPAPTMSTSQSSCMGDSLGGVRRAGRPPGACEKGASDCGPHPHGMP